ncbi:hypothetical protein SAMN05216410_3011 [Sanguibacter gelidistatuariae]|uniref:Uncharacterized protein n=1 Tax=Sanguibacter gelidistatuariae TaxID=1814289 RepID=A0A1G6T532_9MICO|nr:hypothetical protein [Sanguibacter gelidistatuariae]SDD23577.1 hypothetical protein SAMN05216410_3011 [Sanguibacter gelidistatuariae]
MTTHTWIEEAQRLVTTTETTSRGIWTLLAVAGQAAMNLALALPLTEAAGVTLLAMDIRQVQGEIEWIYPDLMTQRPPIAVGMVADHEQDAVKALITDLVAAATARGLQIDPALSTALGLGPGHYLGRGSTR